MKREDLEAREFGLIIASSNFPFYAAPEADAVMDAMEARIKELEHKLYGSSGQSTRLLNRINNFRSTDSKATDLIEDLYKCIHQQMATISKMETTTPKWISVKDRLPESDATQYLVYNEKTKEYGESFFSLILKRFQFHVTHWMPLPPPPTTEVM